MASYHSPSSAKGVIEREEVLMPEYCPSEILHRESEIKELKEAIMPLLENRRPENLFIHGEPGMGKTACVMRVMKELEGSRVKPIYVNCWQHSTRMAVYSIIAKAIDEMMPRRGLARDEVYERIVEIMEKENIRVLLVLDGIESLFRQGEERLLEDIGRAGNGKPLFGLICMSDNAQLLAGKDIWLIGMEFKQYSKTQMADILSGRARNALTPGSWNDAIIGACAAKAMARKGNVRAGLELLWMAAKRAEKAGRTRITLDDVNAVCSCKPDLPLGNSLKTMNLCDEEKLILEILKNGPKSSSELYRTFLKKANRSKRQIRNYLYGLEARKLLSVQTLDFGEENPMSSIRLFQLNLGGSA